MAGSDQDGVDRTALKLAFDPGDYLCTWRLPAGEGEFRDTQGLLTVRPGREPEGQIYGTLPVRWQEGPGEQRSIGLPQHVECEVITARLSTGANAVLTNAQVSYWFGDQGTVSGAAAILTLEGVHNDNQPSYSRVEFQVEGLDAVAGIAPLKKMSFPNPKDGRYLEGKWSAEGNPDSSQEWSDEDAKLHLEYNTVVRTFDPYSYRMGFSPVVRIEVPTALTIREWIDTWVEPIRRMVSIATANARDLTYLATLGTGDKKSTLRGQVFGTGITQKPYESQQSQVRDSSSALMLKTDGVSLLDLARVWQGLEAERHPLVETYGAMLTALNEHPRSRFLLLVQAIEGLYGYETRASYEKRRRRHEKQRNALLQTAEEHLDSDALKFLRSHLRRDPPSSLEDALLTVISGLPVDLMPELDATALVKDTIKENPEIETTVGALRMVRNDLAHGFRGYDPYDLHSVVQILERVVRAHVLQLLGCPEIVQQRALQPSR